MKTFIFRSESSNKTYQTLVQNDNSMSCDCKGWTLRCKNGVRTCKHVRLVQAGCAHMDPSFIGCTDSKTTSVARAISVDQPITTGAARKFNFED